MEPRRVTLMRTCVSALSSNLVKKTWCEKCRNPFLKQGQRQRKDTREEENDGGGYGGSGWGFPHSKLSPGRKRDSHPDGLDYSALVLKKATEKPCSQGLAKSRWIQLCLQSCDRPSILAHAQAVTWITNLCLLSVAQ